MDDDPLQILRRGLLWTIVCAISAAPSFLLAMGEYNEPAMLTGVALFILLLTATTSTKRFLKFRKRPFVRRTLYIGYGCRITLSLLMPVTFIVDIIPGIVIISALEGLGLHHTSYAGTLLITMLQGAALNVLVILFMLIVYRVLRATLPMPMPVLACPSCDYDLRGSLENVSCPECGENVEAVLRQHEARAVA
ncbi:MAG: hypothetical protein CMJ18_21085 [Phycisphaeraceae bacterium]|nr:hypothetical protein [Phycisphaeraceae bacterium]